MSSELYGRAELVVVVKKFFFLIMQCRFMTFFAR